MEHLITNTIFYKRHLLVLALLCCGGIVFGQKYYTKTGSIHFLSVAPLEKIEATNGNAYIVYDASPGQMEGSVLTQGFKFAKALMQQHFNENYLESNKFPKATFKGNISDHSGINLTKDGDHNVYVSGNMTIHGVTKPFRAPGHIIVKDGKISANSSFDISIADYNIEVPKVVRDNIAKTVKVTVNAQLQALK